MPPEVNPDDLRCPVPLKSEATIQLGHGSGGGMTNELIRDVFVSAFGDDVLAEMEDAAVVPFGTGRLALSTDSFVVDPIFFPGGDIGELAVYGTVNDLCMSGARPRYLAVGMILEEGLSIEALRRVAQSMRRAADRVGIRIVTGDTKVVDKGSGDQIFINTTGVGCFDHDAKLSSRHLVPGDRLLLSGSIAEHGIAIMSKREGLAFETTIESDTAPLNELAHAVLEAGGEDVRAMRDATRGGLAAVLNEFAVASQVSIRVVEEAIPVLPAVRGACAFLGLDPMHVANEGKMVVAVAPDRADAVLTAMRAHPLGRRAADVGEVAAQQPGMVSMRTGLGAWRVVDMLVGEQLPRIC